MNDIEFKTGQEHENMKGAFKVLTVKKGEMCICWESGEETTTSSALQGRIIQRIDQERAIIRARRGEKSKKKKAKPSEYAGTFAGLKEGDFSEDITDATWRHYNHLGGAVAVRLASDKFDIGSWPRYGLPEIQWADLDHRRDNDFRLQAKFFARLDNKSFYFGFCIGRLNRENNGKADWEALIEWLRELENDTWLRETALNHNLSIYDTKDEAAFTGAIKPAGGKWTRLNGDEEETFESLADFLGNLAEDTWVDLEIAHVMQKKKAVDRALEIADDVAGLFETLMPLYEAAAVFR